MRKNEKFYMMIRSKISFHSYLGKRKIFCGYLTPKDVVDIHGVIGIFSNRDIIRCRGDIKNGKCNPRWFYFEKIGE